MLVPCIVPFGRLGISFFDRREKLFTGEFSVTFRFNVNPDRIDEISSITVR